MRLLKKDYGSVIKQIVKNICVNVGMIVGLVFATIVSAEMTAFAAEADAVTYLYSSYNSTTPVGINLNGNSVIIQQSDTVGEINIYLDNDCDGIIDEDETMVSLAQGNGDTTTSIVADIPIYGVYETSVNKPVSITMNSGTISGIYGVYNGSIESATEGALSININGGVINYLIGVYAGQVIAGEDITAVDINVTNEVILKDSFKGIEGEYKSGTGSNDYSIIGNVNISAVGRINEGGISNPYVYGMDNSSVAGDFKFKLVGGNTRILCVASGDIDGSAYVDIESCETYTVEMFKNIIIEGNVIINQKPTHNANKCYLGVNGQVKGNLIANLYGSEKDDSFSYHYHLFDEFNVGGNLDLLVSGGNVDCIHAFNNGSIGGYANINIENLNNPNAGYVAEDIFTKVSVGKDISVNIKNSVFTGLFVISDVDCNGNVKVNVENTTLYDSMYVLYSGTQIKGDFECEVDTATSKGSIYGIAGGIVEGSTSLTYRDCVFEYIYGMKGGKLSKDLRLNILNCEAVHLNAVNSGTVQGNIYLNIDAGEYGLDGSCDSIISNEIINSNSNADNIYLNISDVTFGDYSNCYISSCSKLIVDINNSDLGNSIYISGGDKYIEDNIVTFDNNSISNIELANSSLYIPANKECQIDGELQIWREVNLILADKLNVKTLSKDDSSILNLYIDEGSTDIAKEDIDYVYYAINVEKLKDVASITANSATTFSNIDNKYFMQAGKFVELELEPKAGKELESISAIANKKDITDTVTYEKGVCSFTMPEASVTLDAILSQKEKEHIFEEEWSYDEACHWLCCTEDGCAAQQNKEKHIWDEGVIEKETNMPESNIRKYTCIVCGYTKIESIEQDTEIVENGDNEVTKLKVGTKITDESSRATYKVSKEGSEVTYVKPTNSKAKTVTIPATIKKDGVTYKVTSIANKAFSGCKKLKKVNIGKNIIVIGDKAFYKCTALKSITIPTKVSKIGKKAFYGCTALKKITFKTSKLKSKTIGSKAFTGINAKVTISVPKKKYKLYKAILKKKGIGSKANYKKI